MNSNHLIAINNAIDLTDSVKLDCQKFKKEAARFHGQLVMEEFIQFYSHPNEKIRIYPLIIFNAKGEQGAGYWLKAIEWVKKNNIDVVVAAAGFVSRTALFPITTLPAIWFVASGRVTPQIKKESSLFPQALAPKDNLFLIGDYFDDGTVLYDQQLLYQDKIDYYFPSGKGEFVGTSRAVAEASARALSKCLPGSMRECLKKARHEHNDKISNKTFLSF